MPTRRAAKSMAEKLENARGWTVSQRKFATGEKRAKIRQTGPTQMRLSGGGAKPQLDAIEATLFDLVVHRRFLKLKVSREWIQAQARELVNAKGRENPVASDKWLSLFMNRYRLSLRRTTNLISTGFAYMRFTVVLVVTTSGKKLLPLVIWKAKGGNFQRIGNVYVVFQENAWGERWSAYRVAQRGIPQVCLTPTMEASASCGAHSPHLVTIKVRCKEKNIQSVVVPDGMTPYL